MTEAKNHVQYGFSPVNTLSARLIRPLYGQCTKKGLGTINKEKTREIERFARIEIFRQAINQKIKIKGKFKLRIKLTDTKI